MTDLSLPATRFSEREFRVGEAMNKAMQTLSRNVLPFSIVTGVAALPSILLFDRNAADFDTDGATMAILFVVGMLLTFVLHGLSQAIVLNAAFEDMRGRPVDMMASFRAGWRRFLPVILVTLLGGLLTGLAAFALIFPAFMVMCMWYVATPACVVERLGPVKSLSRSSDLTRGSRWRIFGMVIVVGIIGAMGTGMVEAIGQGAGPLIGSVAKVIWQALLGAYDAILVVVTYHDLRVAKEGVDTDQIAAVFE
jgi:hypothetical protein